jgi:hypothetical protein
MHTARFAVEQGRALFCPQPRESNVKSDGLRVLLTTPGGQLCHAIPAWTKHRKLCARLNGQPVARPVGRDNVPEMLESLDAMLRPTEFVRRAGDELESPVPEGPARRWTLSSAFGEGLRPNSAAPQPRGQGSLMSLDSLG